MKKSIVIFCWILFFVAGIAGTASALQYTDIYDAGHFYMDPFGSNNSVSWEFNIIRGGFDPVTQGVTSASVTLNLSDDSLDFWEVATIDVGTNRFLWEVDYGDIRFTIDSLMTLSESSTVDATLRARLGDFYFNAASLYAEGTEPEPVLNAVNAEPTTMFMFGAGLIGLAFLSRKITRKN